MNSFEFNFIVELYWIAPELLREVNLPFNGTQKADVFSFAIVMRELIYSTEVGPYHDIQLDPKGTSYAFVCFLAERCIDNFAYQQCITQPENHAQYNCGTLSSK